MVAAHPLPHATCSAADGERTPTERLRQLGAGADGEGEVVFSSSNPDDIEAYLDATEPAPCASST